MRPQFQSLCLATLKKCQLQPHAHQQQPRPQQLQHMLHKRPQSQAHCCHYASCQQQATQPSTRAHAVAGHEDALAMAKPAPKALTMSTAVSECASYAEAASIIANGGYSAATVNETAQAAAQSCTPTVHQFAVQLHAALEPNERVGLTGDSAGLGEWRLDRCIALQPQGDGRWSANVVLQACRTISYRYFIYVEDKLGRKQIRRWETRLQPRVLTRSDALVSEQQRPDRFGDADGSGETQVNRGWLTNDCIVQLKFEREQMFQVLDIEKFDPAHLLVKIVPLSDDEQMVPESAESGVNVEVAKLKYGQSQLQAQQSFGVAYERGDVVVFHITAPNPLQTAFALLFYTPDQRPVGRAVIAASVLTGSGGVLELQVIEHNANGDAEADTDATIARLELPYLIVKPFADQTLDFRTTYAHYWPKSWPNLNVGHRGNGRSYVANPPAERENTIASFLRAYESYADMIELDVHLTADGVPIIYHDFGLRTAPQGKHITRPEQLEFVLIKDISYAKLKQLRVFAVINNEPVEFPSHNAEPRADHRIFPRLVDVLEGLPKSLGIDVEIKWPQRRICGAHEAQQTIDKNFFIDRVLATVINHGCGRPLIFSSFDADICTMLRFKQNIFPVMFLTMGETKKWTPFADLRTRTFEQAINHAQAFELAGTAPHAEDFLGDNGAQLMQKARNLGQIALVWGDDCNSKERVKYFIDIGATATCYDRADLYMPEGKQSSFFNSTSLMAEFKDQCPR